MARESKYKTKWYDSPKGGTIMRVHYRLWYAIPFNKCGMNTLKGFDTERAAIEYADTEYHETH